MFFTKNFCGQTSKDYRERTYSACFALGHSEQAEPSLSAKMSKETKEAAAGPHEADRSAERERQLLHALRFDRKVQASIVLCTKPYLRCPLAHVCQGRIHVPPSERFQSPGKEILKHRILQHVCSNKCTAPPKFRALS